MFFATPYQCSHSVFRLRFCLAPHLDGHTWIRNTEKSKREHRTTKLVPYDRDFVNTYRFLFDVVFVFSKKALAFSISSCILSVFVRKVTALPRAKNLYGGSSHGNR